MKKTLFLGLGLFFAYSNIQSEREPEEKLLLSKSYEQKKKHSKPISMFRKLLQRGNRKTQTICLDKPSDPILAESGQVIAMEWTIGQESIVAYSGNITPLEDDVVVKKQTYTVKHYTGRGTKRITKGSQKRVAKGFQLGNPGIAAILISSVDSEKEPRWVQFDIRNIK